jgi:hypothetical protein
MKHACMALLLGVSVFAGCQPHSRTENDGNQSHQTPQPQQVTPKAASRPASGPTDPRAKRSPGRVVHVIVCLCDNRNQGIVPVSSELGNGRQPRTNLYWGAMYGVKTFLKRSDHWETLSPPAPDSNGPVLERALFRLKGDGEPVILLAEAYDGAHMAGALRKFYHAAAGRVVRELRLGGEDGSPRRYGLLGGADLVCFVGHNGLMDKAVRPPARKARRRPSGAVVLACRSEEYFRRPMDGVGCPLLVSTRGLMAPEAYTLDALVRAWAGGGDESSMRAAAAEAYAKYQRCSLAAARRLFGAR